MKHEVVLFPNGTASVRPSGPVRPVEAMHSRIGPWREANEIYIQQSDLPGVLRAKRSKEPKSSLVVYDVGFGIGANALALLEALETQTCINIALISFENDLEGIRVALEQPQHFEFLARHEAKIEDLLADPKRPRHIERPRFQWTLHEGCFSEIIGNRLTATGPLPTPDLIYYDLYSPAVTPELWNYSTFDSLRKLCGPQTTLLTYCSSTAVRSALLLAGFHAGRGRSTEMKKETTIACTDLNHLKTLCPPLDHSWLGKLERSSDPLPKDWPGGSLHRAIDILKENFQLKV